MYASLFMAVLLILSQVSFFGQTALQMENYVETNPTDSSKNNLFDHWVWRIDWSDQLLLFPLDKNSHKFVTATIAIIAFVLFILPSQPVYYATASGILGKMYSNTMMVLLNNRIVLQAQDESIIVSDEYVSSSTSMSNPGISQRPASSTSHSGILVTHNLQTVDSSA